MLKEEGFMFYYWDFVPELSVSDGVKKAKALISLNTLVGAPFSLSNISLENF